MVRKILFITETECSPLLGGTARITITLSQAFIAKNIKSYSLYLDTVPNGMPVPAFSDSRQLDRSVPMRAQIKSALEDFGITDCIVNLVSHHCKQLIMPDLYSLSQERHIKVFFCYHAMPGEDFLGAPISYSLYKILHGYDVNQALKDILLKIVPNCIWRPLIRKKYRLAYNNSDMTILLSTRFIPIYQALADIHSNDKFGVIQSALTYNTFLPKSEIKNKGKEILIISRMDERSKRLSLALKIWKELEKDEELKDWKLTIVGGGPDTEYYQKLHKKLQLKRCSFEGRVIDIIPYYQRASIFMMTSSYEGFGLTLTESQQNGVVPIVFNSYASLADIITNGKNGVIIPNGDVDEYVHQCKRLMLDKTWREQMAEQAIDDCKQFCQENIIRRWYEYLGVE